MNRKEMPEYEIWTADLNSDSKEVFAEDCYDIEQARKARREYQDATTAAWIVDKETREIVE